MPELNRPKERIIWFAFSSLLVCALIFVLLGKRDQNLQTKQNQLETVRQQIQTEGNQTPDTQTSTQHALTHSEDAIKHLKTIGFSNPVQDLFSSLQNTQNLIPQNGVLGGTMGFYNPEGFHIISRKWALAEFEDGHQMGHALLRFNTNTNGQTTWKLVDSYLIE